MSLRTAPARWFELLTTRDLVPAAVEAAGRTGHVELESVGEHHPGLDLPDLSGRLERFSQLQERYGKHWPAARFREEGPGTLDATLDDALATLETWAAEADPLIAALEARRAEGADLRDLRGFLAALGNEPGPDFGLLAEQPPLSLGGALYRLPGDAPDPDLPPAVLARSAATADSRYLLVIGGENELARIRETLEAFQARPVPLPSWLGGPPAVALRQVDERLAILEREIGDQEGALAATRERHDLAAALGDIRRMEWLVRQLRDLPVSEHLAWITGWTDDWQGRRTRRALERAGIPALLHFPVPPDAEPPVVLRNPPWVRPFELFARLLGTPGRSEADPSAIVMLVAPLLFGYMFADVGQGLVLLVAGLALRRRLPAANLLVAGGAASMAFGWVFGSVFSLEHVIAPLWTHALANPLPVLAYPIAAGAGLILLGQLLGALEAAWQDRLRHWAATDLGLVVAYLALLGMLLTPASGWLAVAGALWYVAGHGLSAPAARLKAAGVGLAELVEQGMRLAVNTLSFARVGAFALAHAGLSQAVLSLAEAAPGNTGWVLVVILGNALIIALEGLVVSIQTTRLILFEFFIRFLRGEGRPFRPLAPPAAPATG